MEKHKKKYRSSIRSEKAIIRAYVRLLQEKGSGRITVTDIVNLADLNRSTFYGHFTSVDEITERIHSDIFQNLFGSLNTELLRNSLREPRLALEQVMKFLRKDEELYKALLNTGDADKVLKQMREAVVKTYMSDKETLQNIGDKDSFEMHLRMLVGGYGTVVRDWAAGDIKLSIERCTEIISGFISDIVKRHSTKSV